MEYYNFKFRFENDDINDGWTNVWATDFKDAAQKAREMHDIYGNSEINNEIKIIIKKDNVKKKYSVSTYFTINYRIVET